MGKYDKYFIQNTEPDYIHNTYIKGPLPYGDRPIAIDNEADEMVEGACYFQPHIITKPWAPADPNDQRAHAHDVDEYLLFMGFDPDHPEVLGGEVEFWMGGEQHIITNTCLIFIPQGVEHCPFIFRRIDSPIFMFEAGNNTVYQKIR